MLFNCAGFVHQGSILDCPESEWDRSFELNVKAVYKMCKAFIPNVREISEMKCYPYSEVQIFLYKVA